MPLYPRAYEFNILDKRDRVHISAAVYFRYCGQDISRRILGLYRVQVIPICGSYWAYTGSIFFGPFLHAKKYVIFSAKKLGLEWPILDYIEIEII